MGSIFRWTWWRFGWLYPGVSTHIYGYTDRAGRWVPLKGRLFWLKRRS